MNAETKTQVFVYVKISCKQLRLKFTIILVLNVFFDFSYRNKTLGFIGNWFKISYYDYISENLSMNVQYARDLFTQDSRQSRTTTVIVAAVTRVGIDLNTYVQLWSPTWGQQSVYTLMKNLPSKKIPFFCRFSHTLEVSPPIFAFPPSAAEL